MIILLLCAVCVCVLCCPSCAVCVLRCMFCAVCVGTSGASCGDPAVTGRAEADCELYAGSQPRCVYDEYACVSSGDER